MIDILYVICFLVWNIFKFIGLPLMWCWFLGKRTIGELWEGPGAGFTGFLSLAITAMSWFVIVDWGTTY